MIKKITTLLMLTLGYSAFSQSFVQVNFPQAQTYQTSQSTDVQFQWSADLQNKPYEIDYVVAPYTGTGVFLNDGGTQTTTLTSSSITLPTFSGTTMFKLKVTIGTVVGYSEIMTYGTAPVLDITITGVPGTVTSGVAFTFNYNASPDAVGRAYKLTIFANKGDSTTLTPSTGTVASSGQLTVTMGGKFQEGYHKSLVTMSVAGMIQGKSSSTFIVTSVAGTPPIATTPITFPGVKTRGKTTSATPEITWPTLPGANTYCIKVSKDSLFASGVTSVCGLNSPAYTFNSTASGARLEAGGQVYFFQVAGVDANGNQSPWSETQSLEIAGAVTSIENSISTSFSIVPNPASGSVVITSAGSVVIADLLGSIVYSGNAGAINVSGFAKGIYVVKTIGSTAKLVVE